MCEELWYYIMGKMEIHKKKLETYIGPLAPVQHKKLDQFIKPKNQDEELFGLVIHKGSFFRCIPKIIRHEIAALAKMGFKAEDFVHKWLAIDAIKSIYSYCIKPVNSEEY
ncbi:hypothetical protein Ahy_A02g009942 [Arachis hypogaea]|uniref:Uncharacterized protein n=1 Tax=Arachis hypogaea TaxID=3818 RepID=A0A445EIQ2_ARAHY|nr:hypothetical protein Ahy_A02g009942 [Arachis hypogaea]